MTVGIGFLCNDGILICADNQITWPESHKYYDKKIFVRMRLEWTVVFTYAGNPNLAKAFDGKLEAAIGLLPRPYSVSKVQDCIEALLSTWDLLDTDPGGLHMICGIAVRHDNFIMLKTERKVVSRIRDYDYVGVGDSSVLRYMGHLIGSKPEYRKIEEAFPMAVYAVLQAKRYVDGCGGDTDAVVIYPMGRIEDRSQRTYDAEQRLLRLEKFAFDVIRGTFDPSVDDATLERKIASFGKQIKDLKAR